MIAKGLRAFVLGFMALALNSANAQADYVNSSETFSLQRAYEQAKLSPDGQHLAVLAKSNGSWIADFRYRHHADCSSDEGRGPAGHSALLVGE